MDTEDDVCREPIRHWRSAEFRVRAREWVQEALGQRGHEVRGDLIVHRVRFWAAVFTVLSDAGRFWFKATNPGQAFEAPLLACLSQLVPHDVVHPIAVDEARGWLLLPDGGQTLHARGEVTVAEWEALVVQAARMQLALADHEVELAATGLPALRPEEAHEYAACLVEDLAQLPPAHPQHVDVTQARALLRGLSRAEGVFRDLAASGVPMTLQPNDVSASNALLQGSGGAPFRLFDFGDAFWSHPFAALQVPVRMATGAWPYPPAPRNPVSGRLIRGYLEQWPQVSPGDGLVRLVDAADRLASLHRCESWRRLLTHVHPDRLGVTPPRLADWIVDAAREPATAGPPPRWHIPSDPAQGRGPVSGMHFEQMAAEYAEARPPYPGALFDTLEEAGVIGTGLHVLEVGAGAGLATRELHRRGSDVIALEPGAHLAALLSNAVPGVQVLPVRLEDAQLPDHGFDSVVAATSMHWVDLSIGLPKLHRALRPHGWLAIWRTIFGDDDVETEFRNRVSQIVGSRKERDEAPRREQRPTIEELAAGGWFQPVRTERWRWSIDLDARQVGRLFRSFSDWSPTEAQAAARAVEDLGGIVTEHYQSVLHLLRRTPHRGPRPPGQPTGDPTPGRLSAS